MKRFAVGDIHGCANTFEALLEKIAPSFIDKIFLLGDYINKGPDSKRVLDLIRGLIFRGYQVFPVRGNHDQKLIDVVKGNVAGPWKTKSQLIATLDSFNVNSPFDIPPDYLNFLSGLRYYYEEKDYLLVHAGFNFYIKDIFADEPAMLGIKRYQPADDVLKGRKIIQGHIPVPVSYLQEEISKNSQIIKMDTGCVYYTSEEMGQLAAINMDSMELFFQKNLDQPYSDGTYKK